MEIEERERETEETDRRERTKREKEERERRERNTRAQRDLKLRVGAGAWGPQPLRTLRRSDAQPFASPLRKQSIIQGLA